MYLAEKLHLLSGRKSLHTVVRDGYSEIDSDKTTLGRKEKYDNPLLKPKVLAMAVPAFFLLCCTLICPCFQARKKDTDHTVLSKEPISSELHHQLCSNVCNFINCFFGFFWTVVVASFIFF